MLWSARLQQLQGLHAEGGGREGKKTYTTISSPLANRCHAWSLSLQDMYDWAHQEIDEMQSSLAVQQFIQQHVARNPSDIETILAPPEDQDPLVWQYEHLRCAQLYSATRQLLCCDSCSLSSGICSQFCMELNDLAVALQGECTPASCPKMIATADWEFVCAAPHSGREV